MDRLQLKIWNRLHFEQQFLRCVFQWQHQNISYCRRRFLLHWKNGTRRYLQEIQFQRLPNRIEKKGFPFHSLQRLLIQLKLKHPSFFLCWKLFQSQFKHEEIGKAESRIFTIKTSLCASLVQIKTRSNF